MVDTVSPSGNRHVSDESFRSHDLSNNSSNLSQNSNISATSTPKHSTRGHQKQQVRRFPTNASVHQTMITQASLLNSRAAIVTEDSQWGEPVDTALNPVRETGKNDELKSSGPSIGSDLNLNQQETGSIDSTENQPSGKQGTAGIRKIMKEYRRSIK